MKTISVDDEVFDKLGNMAIPFVETTPNMVLRRILGLKQKVESNAVAKSENKIYSIEDDETSQQIERLRSASLYVHPAFLTFLMDKYYNVHGNYKTSEIIPFMDAVNLRLPSGILRNPWMKRPYGGEKNGIISCIRTIEHFRQARRFGCWLGRNRKKDCIESYACIYHPDNSSNIRNKCDLRKEVIWKRKDPQSPFTYSDNYIDVIDKELLGGKGIPLKQLLAVFYPKDEFGYHVVDLFRNEFNINDNEMVLFLYR